MGSEMCIRDRNSSASSAGIRSGDVITEINRKEVKNLADFNRITAKLTKDDNPLLLVRRRSGKFFVVVTS